MNYMLDDVIEWRRLKSRRWEDNIKMDVKQDIRV
jgi:hypothetical protein